jgi:hypothetical protein
MMSDENSYTVEVMLNGHVHQVTVSGNNSPAFGFEAAAGKASGPALLRFRCDVCNGVAKLAFTPPSPAWRRPFIVRSVVHTSHE